MGNKIVCSQSNRLASMLGIHLPMEVLLLAPWDPHGFYIVINYDATGSSYVYTYATYKLVKSLVS